MSLRPAAILLALTLILPFTAPASEPSENMNTSSPDGRLSLEFTLHQAGVPRYLVRLGQKPILRPARLGLVREDSDFSKGLRLLSLSEVETVEESYQILTAKRRQNLYHANRRVIHLENATAESLT